MKSRFTTVDIIAIIKEIKTHYVGHRAIQIYDIDNKTFLIKLSKSGEEGKTMLLIESGIRMHITEFDWPKNPSPSGFSMKLRKHIKNRRLESVTQIGSDRIIDLQFGAKECAFHLIVELYDRGNLVLTDHEYTILHLVRPRVDNNQELKFFAREKYHLESIKTIDYAANRDEYCNAIKEVLTTAKPSDNIRKLLSTIFVYGPNLLEHCALKHGYSLNMKLSQCLKDQSESEIIDKLYMILVDGQRFISEFHETESYGLIFGKFKEDNLSNEITIYEEFHPFLFTQLQSKSHKQIPLFNQAVDEFFSKLESQKSELQINQMEKAALKKLDNIKLDHERRLKELKEAQEDDTIKGELIQMNHELVNRAILIINHAIANQVSWDDIKELVKNGQEMGDPIALLIKTINFESNQLIIKLEDPYEDEYESFVDCNIDLSMNAFSNARKYFSMKKAASTKEQKTINASEKALKSAEVRTKQLLNEVQTVAKINKMRKSNWFEKFNWFISSENYLVVGGKDQQQNEHLVKRYFRPGDIYVHADIHGASTVIIKNHEYPNCPDIPPKTLTEAGHMAVIYSSAWDSKLSTAAWWVRHDQVSKTAPTGEYLTTGSFMIRGKKNYLLASILNFGFGVIFKLADDSIINHINDRRVREIDIESMMSSIDNVDQFTEMIEDNNAESSSSTDTENDSVINTTNNINSNFPNTKLSVNLPNNKQDVVIAKLDSSSGSNVQHNSGSSHVQSSSISNVQHKYMTAKQRRDNKKGNTIISQFTTDNNGDNSIFDTSDKIYDNTLNDNDNSSSIVVNVLEQQCEDEFSSDDDDDNDDIVIDGMIDMKIDTRIDGIIDMKIDTRIDEMIDMKIDTMIDVNAYNINDKTLNGNEDNKSVVVDIIDKQCKDKADGGNVTNNKIDDNLSGPFKRRQRNKLKKMKLKYKDQDDEDREMRIAISKGKNPFQENEDLKPLTKKQQRKQLEEQKKKIAEDKKIKQQQFQEKQRMAHQQMKKNIDKHIDVHEDNNEEDDHLDEHFEDQVLDSSHQIVNSLTGIPLPEDELIYALPILAPYQTLQNYKFKIKMVPGTTKRGKAGKSILFNFIMDKSATSREKDLLKALKDQDITRNFPGKVKIYTSNVNKSNKKNTKA